MSNRKNEFTSKDLTDFQIHYEDTNTDIKTCNMMILFTYNIGTEI